jgi:hypothetical protein
MLFKLIPFNNKIVISIISYLCKVKRQVEGRGNYNVPVQVQILETTMQLNQKTCLGLNYYLDWYLAVSLSARKCDLFCPVIFLYDFESIYYLMLDNTLVLMLN